MISFEEAQQLISETATENQTLRTEFVTIENTINRVLAKDILADRNYPPFNRAAMDGYAVNTEWYNALDNKSMVNQGTCLAGDDYSKPIDETKALKIMTGASVPHNLDSVIKIEDCVQGCDLVKFEITKLYPFTNIAQKGEDIEKGKVILTKGTLLTPQNIQVLATVGQATVEVFTQPKISLLTSGNEIKKINDTILPFQIRNSNKYSITSILQSLNIELIINEHISDDIQQTTSTIKSALKDCEILILTGGVSMGDADFIPTALTKLGITKKFHKTNIKPGKPVWFGSNKNKTVFGLPGNPLSAFITFHLYVKHYLTCSHQTNESKYIKGIIDTDIKLAKIDRFFPFAFVNGKINPKPFNGSGDITALINTIGIVHIKKNTAYSINDTMDCYLF